MPYRKQKRMRWKITYKQQRNEKTELTTELKKLISKQQIKRQQQQQQQQQQSLWRNLTRVVFLKRFRRRFERLKPFSQFDEFFILELKHRLEFARSSSQFHVLCLNVGQTLAKSVIPDKVWGEEGGE